MPCCWRTDLFGIKNKRTTVRQEVLAGIMGWQTVVSSFPFYASLFVEDDEDVDQDATAEIFWFVAGLSTAVFAVGFNVPFIVAPSVLYTTREPGVTMGGHLAAQAIANFAATMFFALALKLSFVSSIPTSLRLGAGCGISMLVSVLGMRSMGLLASDSFTLQPVTWQSVVGLATITAACCNTSDDIKTKKWAFVVGVPLLFTTLVYAVTDQSKFQGYFFAERPPPLSNWGGGTFGVINFSELWAPPYHQGLFVVRMFVSITVNICSILLVLIDAVCLEEMHSKVKSSAEADFSNAIGDTKKFRSMACAIPLMSFFGNLVGVTTQAAFVQSMIVVFAGGKTGLSAAVTGVLLILAPVLRPVLPVLAPGHVSGALAIVISLRFFTVMRKIDVTQPSNLLMFGISILLIPFSFDFVDSLCMAAVVGFLCEWGNKLILRHGRRGVGSTKVAVSAGEQNEIRLDCEAESSTEEAVQPGPIEDDVPQQGSRSTCHPKRGRYFTLPSLEQGLASTGGKHPEIGAFRPRVSFRRSTLVSSVSSRNSISEPGIDRRLSVNLPTTTPLIAGPVFMHWWVALVAMVELVLSAINDQIQSEE